MGTAAPACATAVSTSIRASGRTPVVSTATAPVTAYSPCALPGATLGACRLVVAVGGAAPVDAPAARGGDGGASARMRALAGAWEASSSAACGGVGGEGHDGAGVAHRRQALEARESRPSRHGPRQALGARRWERPPLPAPPPPPPPRSPGHPPGARRGERVTETATVAAALAAAGLAKAELVVTESAPPGQTLGTRTIMEAVEHGGGNGR